MSERPAHDPREPSVREPGERRFTYGRFMYHVGRIREVRVKVVRLASLLTVLRLLVRLRLRALTARGHVTLHTKSFGSKVRRGVRIRVRKGARAHLYLGSWVSLERGTTLLLGSGTIYLDDGVTVGPRTIIEVDRGGSVMASVDATIGVGCILSGDGRDIEIGPEAALDDYATAGLEGEGDIVLGSRAAAGPRALLRGGARLADGAALAAHGQLDRAAGRRPAPPRARPPSPEVSVVVSTKNRASYLPRLFAALSEQVFPPGRFELVLVDDGSTDDTPAAVERLAAEAPFPVHVVRRERSDGPAAGRNAGWRAARAPVIAFTDDDCRPSPEWLAAGLSRLRTDGPDMVQGRTLPEPRQAAAGGMFIITNRVVREGGHYETCNMFYRRSLLEELDGFDERFPYPMAEDTDLALRALDAGHVSRFEPEALLYHDVRTVGWRGILRRGKNLSSHVLLVKKHPGMRKVYAKPWAIKPSHVHLLLLLAGVILGVLVDPLLFALGAPYVVLRLFDREAPIAVVPRLVALPAWMAIDAVEIWSLAVASVRGRRLLL